MPSIGAATAMIVAERIDQAIKTEFDERTQPDAYKLLDLSAKGGDTSYILMAGMFGPMLTAAASAAPQHGTVYGFAVGAFSLLVLVWAARRRKNARRDMDALLVSDAAYWKPIAEKLKRIVHAAGRFDDGLLPAQATKIVR